MKKTKSIIYVNYSPYENSGKILDFLLESFESVFLFTLEFHSMNKDKKYNKLSIFRKGKLNKEYNFIQLPVPSKLIFILLPLRSLINLLQILTYSFKLQKEFGKIDVYFSVNAFTVWIGLILRKLGVVDKTVFWVWDYYPPSHKSLVITIIRRIYWYFDKWATKSSDKVAFVNRRLLELRKKINIVDKDAVYSIVPIGTEIFQVKFNSPKEVTLGFIGVIKRSHGLDAIFDNAEHLISTFPNARFEVVGSGPDMDYFKDQASKSSLPVHFYGYLEGESFNEVLRKCNIGVATYQPDPSNVSYYGDAGKVKRYLSLGMPVLITEVFEFSKEVELNKAGVIVSYENSRTLIDGIKEIMADYKNYQRNALLLGRKYYYKKIYPEMFEF